MKTPEEIYKESGIYTWHLQTYDCNSETYSYGNGFSLKDDDIVCSTISFKSFKVKVMGRLINEDEYDHELQFVIAMTGLGIVFLKRMEIGSSENFGKLASNEYLIEGERIYTTTCHKNIFPNRVGMFVEGTLAFPIIDSGTQPVNSDTRCGMYVLPIDSEFNKLSVNRTMGHIINEKSLERWEKSLTDLRKKILDYESLSGKLRLLFHSVPIIQCNGFPLTPRAVAGSPVFDNDGYIIGMFIGGFDSYAVAIRARTIRSAIKLKKSVLEKLAKANKLKRETAAKRKLERKEEDDDTDRETKKPQIKSLEATGHKSS